MSDTLVILGLIAGAAANVVVIVTVLWRFVVHPIVDVMKLLHHLDDCMDEVKAASAEDRRLMRQHRQDSEDRDRRISELETDYAGLEGYIKGQYGLSIDQKITEIKPRVVVDNGGA